MRIAYSRLNVERTSLDLAYLYEALGRGETLVLDAVDETSPSLRALTMAFARTFGSVPQTNLYASFGSSPGFGIHWDDHDVFVFQIDGRKTWKVFEPTRRWPGYRDFEEAQRPKKTAKPYFDETLAPGTVLYVPRGHWHDVVGLDEPSLHLTLGVTHPTASDVLHWLADEAKEIENLREDLDLSDPVRRVAQTKQLRAFLEQKLTDSTYEEYLRHRRRTLEYRPHPSLPSAVTGILEPRTRFSWQGPLEPQFASNGDVIVCCAGKEATFDARARLLIDRVWMLKNGSLQDLLDLAGATEDDARTVLLALAQIGAISLHEDNALRMGDVPRRR